MNICDATKRVKRPNENFSDKQKTGPIPSGTGPVRGPLPGTFSAQPAGDLGSFFLRHLRVDLCDPCGSMAQPGLRGIEAHRLTGFGRRVVSQLHGRPLGDAGPAGGPLDSTPE